MFDPEDGIVDAVTAIQSIGGLPETVRLDILAIKEGLPTQHVYTPEQVYTVLTLLEDISPTELRSMFVNGFDVDLYVAE